jgi:hypothetical protein
VQSRLIEGAASLDADPENPLTEPIVLPGR